MIIIAAYLLAIVLANLLVAQFGPSVTILNAFLFIGLDLTARDRLHDTWHGRGLRWKMPLLILVGSLLSAVLNWNAAPIALASCLAFGASAAVDTLVYGLLRWQPRLVRMNGSNLFSAAIDSVLFPALAFGFPLMWGIVIGQFAAKVFGGFLWSLMLNRK